MKRRHSLSYSKSQRVFKKGAKTHIKNIQTNPMRGGIRL